MPKIRTKKTKYPKDWPTIESTILDFEQQMRDAETESLTQQKGKKKRESTWQILKVHHNRSRYIYEMYYKKREISRELYEFCLREEYADAQLIAKWKKQGYEKLCCLQCIQSRDHQHGTTCICRVPKAQLSSGGGNDDGGSSGGGGDDSTTHHIIRCNHCGCTGCASSD